MEQNRGLTPVPAVNRIWYQPFPDYESDPPFKPVRIRFAIR